MAHQVLEVRRADRGFDRVEQVQAQLLAVLGDVGDAQVDRLLDGLRGDLLAVQHHRPGVVDAVAAAEDGTRQLGAPGTHQARETDDLPRTDVERGVLGDHPAGHVRVLDIPVAHLQQHLAGVGLVVGVAVLDRAADHRANDAVLVHLTGDHVVGLHRLAVADDGDGIADRSDLVELVGDHDLGDALGLQAAHQVEQVGRVVLVQGRGGLVQDQQADVLRQRLGDLHQLLLADAEAFDRGVRVDVQADSGQQVDRAVARLRPVDQAALDDLVAQEDVLGDRQLGHQGQLLVDDHDTLVLGVLDPAEVHHLAVEHDVAAIGAVRVDTRQHLHQGGLARTVLATDGVDVSLAHPHRDIIQGLDTRELLGDVAHLQDDVLVIDHVVSFDHGTAETGRCC